MTVVNDKIERLQHTVRRVAAMHGLAAITNDHILHKTPYHVVENGHAKKRQAISPGDENGSEDNQSDPRLAVEILLKVELIVAARRTMLNDRSGRGGDD